ncbi:MAG: regulatory protein RecX [Clostridia bacterium]
MEQFKRALATSFRILSKKAYSRHEIEQKLIKFEYDEEIVEQVLAKLEEMKLVDDEEYADIIIEGYTQKGWGKQKIREELYKRGVPSDISKEKLTDYDADYDVILKHYENKLRGDISEYKNVEKAKAFLYRKGFSFDEISTGYLLYKEKLEDSECL